MRSLKKKLSVFLKQDPDIIWGALDNCLLQGLTWSKIHHITNACKDQMRYWRDCNGYTDSKILLIMMKNLIRSLENISMVNMKQELVTLKLLMDIMLLDIEFVRRY